MNVVENAPPAISSSPPTSSSQPLTLSPATARLRYTLPAVLHHTSSQKHGLSMQLYNMSPEKERKEFLDKLFDYMHKKGGSCFLALMDSAPSLAARNTARDGGVLMEHWMLHTSTLFLFCPRYQKLS